MSEWRPCTIGELCDEGLVKLQTGPFGSQLHAHDYVQEGVPVIPTEALRNRQINHSVLPKVSPEKAEELCRHRHEPGDILFARRGVQATGHIGYVREPEDGFLCGTGAIRLRVVNGRQPQPILPEFLSHVFANPASVAWFKIHAIGATMPNLNEGIIRDFPLRLPPTAEQRRIAGVLSALDDKIDLNRRINQTLEAIARAVFKSWFMDFDPVRNQIGGGHVGRQETSENVGNLFPSSFQASELGPIPVGWHVDSLDGVCEFAYGRTLPEEMRHKGSVPVYGSNGQVGWHDEALVKGPGIVIGRKGNPGTVVWVEDDFYPIDTTFYVVSKINSGLTYLRYALATLRKASPHRSTSHSWYQQTRDNILCERQKVASASDCAPHTKGISRSMDATRAGTL